MVTSAKCAHICNFHNFVQLHLSVILARSSPHSKACLSTCLLHPRDSVDAGEGASEATSRAEATSASNGLLQLLNDDYVGREYLLHISVSHTAHRVCDIPSRQSAAQPAHPRRP